jgi:pimeloyl-ACP methyl ester carboxylesterase
MILDWGFGERGTVGGNAAPGLWLKGHARRLLERALRSALGPDLAACDEDSGAVEAAARVKCPAVVVSGVNDRMTPLVSSRKLAERIPGAVVVEIPRCGHMSMVEEPAAVTAAIARIA